MHDTVQILKGLKSHYEQHHQVTYTDAALRAADSISGEQTWQQYCAFCHTLKTGQANMAGPNLHELFKRGIGTKADFAYSAFLFVGLRLPQQSIVNHLLEVLYDCLFNRDIRHAQVFFAV